MTKWFVIPCYTEWENQGNLLYQISPQISMCQRLHLRYQFIRDAFGPMITDHWELLDLTIACFPRAFSTIASLLRVGSDSVCICSLLKLQLLPPQNLKYARDFLSKLQTLTHLIITAILSSKYCYVSPFTNEEAEARGYIICPRL